MVQHNNNNNSNNKQHTHTATSFSSKGKRLSLCIFIDIIYSVKRSGPFYSPYVKRFVRKMKKNMCILNKTLLIFREETHTVYEPSKQITPK